MNGGAASEPMRGSEGEQVDRESGPKRRYRFGLVLSAKRGNVTRHQNFRKFAERESDIDSV